MSDTEVKNGGKGSGSGKGLASGWTEHEVLVYLFTAMEKAGWAPDYGTAPVPVGRNANGCRQKINKLKAAFKPEMHALKNSEALPAPAEGSTPKKTATPKKRKGKTDDEGTGDVEASPAKKGRGRPKKKAAEPEVEQDEEVNVKEVHSDDDLDVKT